MYINEQNFSIWCDFVERDFLDTGFRSYIEEGVVSGATSNPSIFFEAISKSPSYISRIKELAEFDTKTVYEILATEDIRKAASILRPIYESKNDGFVSLEIDPTLCDKVKESVLEGERLYAKIGMPNTMIKVPATEAGYTVIKELLSEGINVNVTLIFSPEQAKKALQAIKEGQSLCKERVPASVISIFVSRFDRKCDAKMKECGLEPGRLGIYNAQYIYRLIENEHIPNTRTLFASTGVKGDSYPPTYYVDNLMFTNCINTIPTSTIDALLKNRNKEIIRPKSISDLEDYFALICKKEFNLDSIYNELMDEGLQAFKVAFADMLKAIEQKRG